MLALSYVEKFVVRLRFLLLATPVKPQDYPELFRESLVDTRNPTLLYRYVFRTKIVPSAITFHDSCKCIAFGKPAGPDWYTRMLSAQSCYQHSKDFAEECLFALHKQCAWMWRQRSSMRDAHALPTRPRLGGTASDLAWY